MASSEDGSSFNDARQIDRQTFLDYAGHLRQQVEHGELTITTAQNRLSSVNRTMATLRGDQYVKVPSPSEELGLNRTTICTKIPQGQDRDQVIRIAEALREEHPRAAVIAELARTTGMRLGKASLADLPRLINALLIRANHRFDHSMHREDLACLTLARRWRPDPAHASGCAGSAYRRTKNLDTDFSKTVWIHSEQSNTIKAPPAYWSELHSPPLPSVTTVTRWPEKPIIYWADTYTPERSSKPNSK